MNSLFREVRTNKCPKIIDINTRLSVYYLEQKNKKVKKKMAQYKIIELDLWTAELDRFLNEFQSLNDVKMEEEMIIDEQGNDKRYSLPFRNFGGELNFPEQSYWQLKNIFGDE